MTTTNKLLLSIFELEEMLKRLNIKSEGKFSITASNKGEIWDAFHHLNIKDLKLYKPFEIDPIQNYYFFEYPIPGRPNLTIKVKSKPQKLS